MKIRAFYSDGTVIEGEAEVADWEWEGMRVIVSTDLPVGVVSKIEKVIMNVYMVTQGSYSDYRVLALFTSRELALEYATALATKERERGIESARESLERYDREGSSWDEKQIANLRLEWAARRIRPEEIERMANEIRNGRRGVLVRLLAAVAQPLDMEGLFDPDGYDSYAIEEQELYDMVPVVKEDK